MFHHDSYEFGSWVECTHGISTLYSISMIKTLIIQHFEIFVGWRSKFNLLRNWNLGDIVKDNRKPLKNSFEISVKWMEKKNSSIPSKKTGNQWYSLKMMEYQHKNNVKKFNLLFVFINSLFVLKSTEIWRNFILGKKWFVFGLKVMVFVILSHSWKKQKYFQDLNYLDLIHQ